MDFKDHLAILREQYKQECDDNAELFRRGNFMYILIAALGTFSIKLALSITWTPGLSEDWRIRACGGAMGFLVIAGGCLVRALLMGDWKYPDLDEVKHFATQGSIPLTSDEKLMREYATAVAKNRPSNEERYDWLSRSFIATVVAAVLILAQIAASSLYARQAEEHRQKQAQKAGGDGVQPAE